MARQSYVTQTKDLPPEAVTVAQRVGLLGFSWRFFPEKPLADLSRRVQVRDTDELAPSREVAHYAQALRNGDRMPPVVITKDGYLVDGATRTEAARRARRDFFPAIELDCAYEGSGDAMRQQLIILGSAFNLTHGRGMSRENVERVIAAVAEEDDSPRDIARKLHISEATVSSVLNGMKARSLALKLGVKLDDTLSASHMKFFGGKTQKYTHPVFREFIVLAQEARLGLASVSLLAKQLEAAGTEDERLAILAESRTSLRQVIIAGAAPAPSRAGRLRQALGYLCKQDNPDLLVELNTGYAGEHMRVLNEAIERLQKIRAAQARLDMSRLDSGE